MNHPLPAFGGVPLRAVNHLVWYFRQAFTNNTSGRAAPERWLARGCALPPLRVAISLSRLEVKLQRYRKLWTLTPPLW
jgi:hypothetical protein